MPCTYTVRDVCDRFGVHEQSVLQWIRSGELVAVNVGREPGKQKPRWRITAEALADFEDKRKSAQPNTCQARPRSQV